MKERGSDREKGSAKSCQPEIKQAGTLPIPKPLHPPQSHILPLHSLSISLPCFHLPSLSLSFPSLLLQRDIFKPWFYSALTLLTPPYIPSYLRHYLRLTSDLVCLSPRVSVWCSFKPLWGQTMPLFIVP